MLHILCSVHSSNVPATMTLGPHIHAHAHKRHGIGHVLWGVVMLIWSTKCQACGNHDNDVHTHFREAYIAGTIPILKYGWGGHATGVLLPIVPRVKMLYSHTHAIQLVVVWSFFQLKCH